MNSTPTLTQCLDNACAHRWTLRPEYEQNPLACLLDYFPGGFQVRYYSQDLAQVVVAEFMPCEGIEYDYAPIEAEVAA